MARSQNAMDVYRREQKKKELKKHQAQRNKEKQAKLNELDSDEIQARIKKLARQIEQNPADGPTRKRKQELDETLQSVLKRQKAAEEDESANKPSTKNTLTLSDIDAANRERYQNPENSIYYHPVLNPFGAPPPGQPQRYRVPPPAPVKPPKPPQAQHAVKQNRPRAQPQGAAGPGRMAPRRPGKRPPFPPGPPPPSTIQVPVRPPLPQSITEVAPLMRHLPPPPPPVSAVPPPPPPPPPSTTHEDVTMEYPPPSPYPPSIPFHDIDMEVATESDVVAAYPPPPDEDSEEEADRAMQQARIRSFVPTTLRTHRPQPSAITSAPRLAPRPPLPSASSAPGPALVTLQPPPPTSITSATGNAASPPADFDAFMQEMKQLGAV